MAARWLPTILVIACAAASPGLWAANPFGADEGKFLLTGGFSDVDGSGGGGLVPLAFISGYGSNRSWGANAHYTDIRLRDLDLRAYGVSVGLFDRVELGFTRQNLDVTGTALDGLGVTQNNYIAKVKLLGNAVYLQDAWLPQVSVGVEYKQNGGIKDAGSVGLPGLVSPTQLGAKGEHAADYYLCATKILLAESVVVNAVVRYTKANQFGLLGFGGDRHGSYSAHPEFTAAYLLTRHLAVGGEYRDRPHNLSVDEESRAWDVFAGWAPTKNLSLVLAYLDIGSVLAPATGQGRRQNGLYLSLQAGF